MFYGVLEMPYEMAMEGGEIAKLQFYNRVQEAVRRLKLAEAALAKQVPAQEQDAARFVFEHTQHEAMYKIEIKALRSDTKTSLDWWRAEIDAAQLAQSADTAEGE